MAAGDLIDDAGDCYQVELSSYLVADGQPWKITGFSGLEPTARENVYPLGHDDGSTVGPEYVESLVLVWEVVCAEGTVAGAEEAIDDLRTAWAPAAGDVACHFFVPFRGHLSVSGRPHGGIAVDRSDVAVGVARATLTFFAPDPTITVVP